MGKNAILTPEPVTLARRKVTSGLRRRLRQPWGLARSVTDPGINAT